MVFWGHYLNIFLHIPQYVTSCTVSTCTVHTTPVTCCNKPCDPFPQMCELSPAEFYKNICALYGIILIMINKEL